ncbi:pyridoxine 5'-phosphate synthase [Frigoriglobus tundricola]|uniref:Pyridoxine 5'-phosphate synthase n=1 Tax=Frigoriglobus tundricola TaxID=2774151 RepID=A0A6M5YYC2_9BACT|nr:pyridoxine 5'-phosphate synthase [Frigoriglobus tundricola]QJW98213.1 Pyridoxine 5'-phosphate synthase [Frigoriglobus tundricola]
MIRLGVNIDHVATVRQARRANEPDPVAAAVLATLGGADGITVHLREDRRHIQDRDVYLLRETVTTRLNLELAAYDEIIAIALKVKPDEATLVPEKRQELTTEGGLDVTANVASVSAATERLKAAGIHVSLFIDPDPRQIDAAHRLKADAIEFQTASYSEAKGETAVARELEKLRSGTAQAVGLGLHVHMGHGLNYWNVQPVVRIAGVEELNIGHSIVSRAVLVGMDRAVREMKQVMQEHYPNPRK